MVKYPYTQNYGRLREFIDGIPGRGIPDKITFQYLNTIGFKSSNDRGIVGVLRFISVITSDGVPTKEYKELRNRGSRKETMARLVRQAYKTLFETYPDADRQGDEKLKDFFASQTNLGEAAQKHVVNTFKALCEQSDFNRDSSPSDDLLEDEDLNSGSSIAPPRPNISSVARTGTDVHINIQIHVPGGEKPEVYEDIFKNMGKYVFGNRE